jgi:glutamate N-acetyltransferase/amino-acid N-acetyltransferase
MLCYVMTDLKIKREKLDQMLKSAVSKSFNTISIDGDQSTSDTVLALSSNEYESSEEDEREFQSCLNEIWLWRLMDKRSQLSFWKCP